MSNEQLIEIAKHAMKNSYSPYSNFKVGAALLVDDDIIFEGCNIENSSYGATICAERTAMFSAISKGYRHFKKIAIVCSDEKEAYPCGICLQVMNEFMKDGEIILNSKENGICSYTLKQLLPYGFELN